MAEEAAEDEEAAAAAGWSKKNKSSVGNTEFYLKCWFNPHICIIFPGEISMFVALNAKS